MATRILFATDIHGSEGCFRKFLSAAQSVHGPDVLIIGGDITGKQFIPIVETTQKGARACFEGKDFKFRTQGEVANFEKTLRDKGAYTWRCDSDAADRLKNDATFLQQLSLRARATRLREWIDLADRTLKDSGRRVFLSGGNDDPWEIDDILRESETIVCPEGRVVEISNSLTMLSTGVANITPWNCFRDVSEDEIGFKIADMAAGVEDFDSCIFNLHCPPFDTLLDRAPKLDKDRRIVASAFGVEEESVGSWAVKQAIERYQPVASLHGHIHESRAFQRIGRTVSINPGSEYAIGRLNVALLEFQRNKLIRFDLVTDVN